MTDVFNTSIGPRADGENRKVSRSGGVCFAFLRSKTWHPYPGACTALLRNNHAAARMIAGAKK